VSVKKLPSISGKIFGRISGTVSCRCQTIWQN